MDGNSSSFLLLDEFLKDTNENKKYRSELN